MSFRRVWVSELQLPTLPLLGISERNQHIRVARLRWYADSVVQMRVKSIVWDVLEEVIVAESGND
jgi:hypothetical protein